MSGEPTDSDRLDDTLRAHAEACHSLWEAWLEIASQLAHPAPVTAPASGYARAFTAKHAEARPNIAFAAGQYAGRYVSGMGAHVLGLAALVSAREFRLSYWAAVRAELELGGRVCWLIAPEKNGTLPEPDVQVARALMETLADARRHAKRAKTTKLAPESRRFFNDAVAEVEADLTAVFPGWVLKGMPEEQQEEADKWQIRGERYVGLSAGVKRFADFAFEGVPGLYDLLSAMAHPSIISLGILAPVRVDDGVAVAEYSLKLEDLESIVQLACVAFYRAAMLVVTYFELDDSPLMAWSAARLSWFSSAGE
ncbi:hypothetical protein ACIQTX_14540 [Microbacterium sp. NPDC090281]|uniref:hypothetical protein n=1 Tax=Microbacterium sp. NPDC090281 TaxID=3364208 RepID=UPI00380B44F7